MTVSASSPADLVNLALRQIGYRLRVGSLLDGSDAANQALDLYAQTRDEMLRTGDWGFAERNLTLELLKSAPAGGYIPPTVWTTTYPPLPWAYEYAYPGDCLKIRALKQSPLFLFNPDPQPMLFSIANDSAVSTTDTELTSLALNSPGTGVYAPSDTIILSGGESTTPASLTVSTTKAVSATIAVPGTGGTPGAATVTGTTGTGTKFQAGVTISGGGVITSVDSISLAGSYTANPTDPTLEPVTGGSLAGAKLNVKMGVASFAIADGGIFTEETTTFTQGATSGTGTGATFQTGVFGAVTETQRVILANVADAIAVYTGQVTNPADWDVDFTEAFAAALAARLTPSLGNAQLLQIAEREEAAMTTIAMREQG